MNFSEFGTQFAVVPNIIIFYKAFDHIHGTNLISVSRPYKVGHAITYIKNY